MRATRTHVTPACLETEAGPGTGLRGHRALQIIVITRAGILGSRSQCRSAKLASVRSGRIADAGKVRLRKDGLRNMGSQDLSSLCSTTTMLCLSATLACRGQSLALKWQSSSSPSLPLMAEQLLEEVLRRRGAKAGQRRQQARPPLRLPDPPTNLSNSPRGQARG